MMIQIHCPSCDKLLCVTDGNLEIKCNRCKSIVRRNKDNQKITSVKEPPRETLSGKRFY